MKNKVLVLGGSGFLGNHVINALLLNDYKVCSVDLNPSKISHKNFDFISLNLSENIQELSRYSEDFNYVINFAGISDLDYCHENPKESLEFNIQSNIDILDIFKNSKKLKNIFMLVLHMLLGQVVHSMLLLKKHLKVLLKNIPKTII